jgi:hypothetical protein
MLSVAMLNVVMLNVVAPIEDFIITSDRHVHLRLIEKISIRWCQDFGANDWKLKSLGTGPAPSIDMYCKVLSGIAPVDYKGKVIQFFFFKNFFI